MLFEGVRSQKDGLLVVVRVYDDVSIIIIINIINNNINYIYGLYNYAYGV